MRLSFIATSLILQISRRTQPNTLKIFLSICTKTYADIDRFKKRSYNCLVQICSTHFLRPKECSRHRVKEVGVSSRCYFHEGYLDSLPAQKMHNAATCFLVSQFMLDKKVRSDFFLQIANRLKPDGILASADLLFELDSANFDAILGLWQRVMATSSASPEGLSRMKAAYSKDVAVLPPTTVASIIKSGRFETPVQFFQAGLIHAWFAKRA